ncbi:MAG: hypothetical protein CFK48_00200 [Armatimonadetes bacterium CP1_7O]|nr:MAG: hypothetical protein CFK48_00200 [Armatimonadetes bacterium CP1_7O]RMH10275.1 MAG: hypothetical protein D6697_01620 [Armatimonadota bacterium]
MRLIICACLMLWTAGFALAAESIAVVPRNSYLIRPVASASDLANQIRTEPIVAQRYARHFKRSAWEIAEYVEKNLRLTRLEKAQTFNVYYSPPDDRLMVVRRTLPKGTPVFVEKKTGKPVLKANCGNPLTPAVSIRTPQAQVPIEVTSIATPQPVFAAMIDAPQLPTVELVETAEAPLEEVVAADVLPTETLVETLPEAAPEPEAPPVVMAVASSSANQIPMISGGGFNWLPFLPFIAVIVARAGDDDFEPIPEPTSLMVLGMGLSVLYPLSRKVFSRSQNSSQRTGDSNTHSA